MTVTRSGNSSTMLNTHIPNSSPCEHTKLQKQITHITNMSEQLSNRMDVADEQAREGARSPNRRGRGPRREDSLEGSHRIRGENLETEYGRDFEPHHHPA